MRIADCSLLILCSWGCEGTERTQSTKKKSAIRNPQSAIRNGKSFPGRRRQESFARVSLF